jgi:hypothetical protein
MRKLVGEQERTPTTPGGPPGIRQQYRRWPHVYCSLTPIGDSLNQWRGAAVRLVGDLHWFLLSH